MMGTLGAIVDQKGRSDPFPARPRGGTSPNKAGDPLLSPGITRPGYTGVCGLQNGSKRFPRRSTRPPRRRKTARGRTRWLQDGPGGLQVDLQESPERRTSSHFRRRTCTLGISAFLLAAASKRLKRAPRGASEDPKAALDAPKTGPTGPQILPCGEQANRAHGEDRVLSARVGPGGPERPRRDPYEASKRARDGLKAAQEASETLREGLKKTPMRAPRAPTHRH